MIDLSDDYKEISNRREKIKKLKSDIRTLVRGSAEYYKMLLKINGEEHSLQNKENDVREEILGYVKETLKQRHESQEIDDTTYILLSRVAERCLNTVELLNVLNNNNHSLFERRIRNKRGGIEETGSDISEEQHSYDKLKTKSRESIKNCAILFYKRYCLQQGLMSKEKCDSLISKEKFDETDLDSVIDIFSSIIDGKEKVLTMDTIKDTLPESDIKSATEVDSFTKGILCKLYNVRNSDDIEIFAIHNYSHKKIGGEKSLELGDSIGLYCFNKKTGMLELMQSDEFNPCVVSKGEEIDVHNPNSIQHVQEIATLSYAGFQLSYYNDENGNMHIGRKEKGIIKETLSQSLEQYQKVIAMRQKIETGEITEDEEEPQSPDDLHLRNKGAVEPEILLAGIKEIVKTVPPDDRVNARKKEEQFRENVEGRGNLL